MKAACIRAHGDASVIAIEEIDSPAPGPGEVLVAVRSAALNHLDIWVRKGGRIRLDFPHVLGSDAAGVVQEVGDAVDGIAAGQEVVINPGLCCGHCEFCRAGQQSLCVDFGLVGMARDGTFAEAVTVPARCVAPKPEHLDFHQAAALTLAHLTAWRMLMTRADLRPGQTVLIHGIGGGVALAGLQIAKFSGAWVAVTSSASEKLDSARSHGADACINYTETPDVASAVRDLTDGRGVDVVLDAVGAATVPVGIDAVRRGGTIVNCGVTTGAEATISLQKLYWNQVRLIGSTMGSDEDFRQMLAAVAANRLVPVIDSTYPLTDVVAATERMEAGRQMGKIVLQISG